MNNFLSMPVGLLTLVVANLTLVAGWWWWSRREGVGPWLRAAVILLALVGVAGGAVTYRAARLKQEAAEAKNAELRKDIAGLRTDLTNALAVNRVQEAKLVTLERSASEQRQLDAERAAALEADLQKAMEDTRPLFRPRNADIEHRRKDATANHAPGLRP